MGHAGVDRLARCLPAVAVESRQFAARLGEPPFQYRRCGSVGRTSVGGGPPTERSDPLLPIAKYR